MAPSAKVIKQALVDGTCAVFREDPDAISVNKVRRHVTDELELGEDFFNSGEWKQNSKLVIKETVDKLHDGWDPEAEPVKKPKNGVKKRHSSDEEAEEPQTKRRKSVKPAKKVKKEASDVSDEEEDEPKPKRRQNSKSAKPVKNEVSDDSEEEEDEPKPKRRKNSKSAVKEEDSDVSDEEEEKPARKQSIARRGAPKSADVSSDDEEDETKKTMKKSSSPELKRDVVEGNSPAVDVTKRDSSEDEEIKAASTPDDSADDTKPSVAAEDSKDGVVNEEDEYSDVIDEGPAPKRRGRPKKEQGVKKEKGVKKEPRESKKKTAPDTKSTDTDPNEAEIKKLQGHLTKCGVRKLWHIELKKYGDDARAKIKHLRGMLKEIGMDGRFSEQKAREIKEMRELKAEVEAAEEMNALWGTEGRAGRGVKRGKSKGVKMEESDEDEDGEDEVKDEVKEEDDDKDTFAARRRRAQADLAFLGDDSDSD